MKNPLPRIKALYSYAKLVQNPNDLDRVFDMADSEGSEEVLEHHLQRLLTTPAAHSAVQDRYRIGEVDLEALARLPQNTLGFAYAQFMIQNGLRPDAIRNTESTPTPARYQMAHLRESHDIWHVMAGFGADIPGEVGVQALTAAQTGSPLSDALLSALLLNNAMHPETGNSEAMYHALTEGWRIGRASKPLFGARWGELWAQDLRVLRAEYNIVPFRELMQPAA